MCGPGQVLNSSMAMTNWSVADASLVVNGGEGDQCPTDPETNRQSCTPLDQFSAAYCPPSTPQASLLCCCSPSIDGVS